MCLAKCFFSNYFPTFQNPAPPFTVCILFAQISSKKTNLHDGPMCLKK